MINVIFSCCVHTATRAESKSESMWEKEWIYEEKTEIKSSSSNIADFGKIFDFSSLIASWNDSGTAK